jgi:hypothetical protein
MTSEKRCELLYQHYKDTRDSLSKIVDTRMRMLPVVFTVIGLILFYAYYTEILSVFLFAVINGRMAEWGVPLQPEDTTEIAEVTQKIMGSLLWFALTTGVNLIFGYTSAIERLASYLCRLEQQMCGELEGLFISRENEQRVGYNRRIHLMYYSMFIGWIGLVIVVGVNAELKRAWDGSTSIGLVIADLIMVLAVIYSSYEFLRGMIRQTRAKAVQTTQPKDAKHTASSPSIPV